MSVQRWFNTITAALAVTLLVGSFQGMRMLGQYEERLDHTVDSLHRMQNWQANEYTELKSRFRGLERTAATLETQVQRLERDGAYRQ